MCTQNILGECSDRMSSRVHSFRTLLAVLANHVSIFSTLHLEPRVFGYVAYVHLHKNQRSKLDPCAVQCVFIDFSPQQKRYKCYHPPTRHTYVTMDVIFSEDELPPSHTFQGGMIGGEDYG